MSANLQTKLDSAFNDILRTAGFIFEIINNNEKQSRLITGPNNQLIQPTIIQQLTNHINKFDDILDETVFKFNDAKWCIDTMIENKQKQQEMKIKEELERQRREAEEAKRLKEEAEAKKKAEAEAAAKAKLEAEARAKAEAEAKAQAEKEKAEAERLKKEEEEREAARRAKEEKEEEERRNREAISQQQQQQQQQQDLGQSLQSNQYNNFDDFIGFDMNDLQGVGNDDGNQNDDFLSSINYNDLNLDMPMGSSSIGGSGGNGGEAVQNGGNNVFDDMDIDNDMNFSQQQTDDLFKTPADDPISKTTGEATSSGAGAGAGAGANVSNNTNNNNNNNSSNSNTTNTAAANNNNNNSTKNSEQKNGGGQPAAQNDNLEEMDLDLNNLLGNDELILDGLNMSLLDAGLEGEDDSSNMNMNQMGDEFDVDNFLNQFSS